MPIYVTHLLYFVSVLLLPVIVFGQTRMQINEKCVKDWYNSVVTCSGGIWPVDRDLTFPFHSITNFAFEHLEFNCDKVRALPADAVGNLKRLSFNRIQAVNDAGQMVSFGECLNKFLAHGHFFGVEWLSFTDTQLSILNGDLFRRFDGLRLLQINNAYVSEITVDALNSLTRLSGLELVNDDTLKTFYFDRLGPVSDSLMNLVLKGNTQLSAIELSPNAPAVALKWLTTVMISNNPLLTTLPNVLLNAIPGNFTRMEFIGNGVQCGSCHLKNLITWNRATEARYVAMECGKDCGLLGTPYNMGFVNRYFDGIWCSTTSGFYWTPEDEPACQSENPELLKPCSLVQPHSTL